MSDIDTEDLLRRRLRQLAVQSTAGATWTPGRTTAPGTSDMPVPVPVPVPVPADDAPGLATVQPITRAGRQRSLRRPAAFAVAVSAAAAVLIGAMVLTGGDEQANSPAIASDPGGSEGAAVAGAAPPPYLALSGTHWLLTGFRDMTGTWVDVDEAKIDPADPRYDVGFVAGYAYSSGACGDWITDGLGTARSTSTLGCVPAVLQHPVSVTSDGETLTVMGSAETGIRARRDGDAEPQTVPKAWLADTTWAVRAAGDARPSAGEDLAWVRFVPGSLPDGNGAVTSFVGVQDVTPCEGGQMDTRREVPVRCDGDELHQRAMLAAVSLWGAAEDVSLAGDELVVTGPAGELRARLVAADRSTPATDPAAPSSTVVQGGVNVVPDGAAPVFAAEVAGRSFRVLSVVGPDGRPLAVEGVALRFEDGTITGSSSCYSITGTYLPVDGSQSETGGSLTVTSMVTGPQQDCTDTARAEADTLVEALERGTYAWRNSDLSLRTSDGRTVTLVADPPSGSLTTTAVGVVGGG